MIKLIRERDCIYRETYVLDLDEEYVASVANRFHEETKQRYLGQIEITAELLGKAFKYDLTPEENIEIKVYGYVYHLQDYLAELVSDDIWDCEMDTQFMNTYDSYYDTVEKY